MTNEEIDRIIERGKAFVYAPFQIKNICDLVDFENKYCQLLSELEFSIGDVSYDFNECELSLLSRKPFGKVTSLKRDELYDKFSEYKLDDIEICIIRSFLQQVSGMYRFDAYSYGLPPFAEEIIRRLQTALAKLPSYGNARVVRQLNDYDTLDLLKNDIYEPCYSMTTSANEKWNDGKGNQYVIISLPKESTKAHSIIFANTSEKQVTFLIGAKFLVDDVVKKKDGSRTIFMHEII